MKWFEPIIIIVAIGLVLLPIFLQIKNKKKGKSSCVQLPYLFSSFCKNNIINFIKFCRLSQENN